MRKYRSQNVETASRAHPMVERARSLKETFIIVSIFGCLLALSGYF